MFAYVRLLDIPGEEEGAIDSVLEREKICYVCGLTLLI